MGYRCFAAICTVFLLLPVTAQCWWDEGHQVVARIAVHHLNRAALLRVSQILDVENTPEAIADAMATASIWADQVKAETATGKWHFINLTLQDSRASIPQRCPTDDCAPARIRIFADQLKAARGDDDSDGSDQDALRFLVHFVGDLHQPLHAISNADQGGNCETLESQVDEAKNVQALWDGPLVSNMGNDDTALATELNEEIDALDDQQRTAFASGNPEDWAWESHRLAVVNIYKRLNIPKQDILFPASCSDAPEAITENPVHIDAEYAAAMTPIVREQLMKAGLRLANLLNHILG